MKRVFWGLLIISIFYSSIFGDLYLKIPEEGGMVNINQVEEVHYLRVSWISSRTIKYFIDCGLGKDDRIKRLYDKKGDLKQFNTGMAFLNYLRLNGWKLISYEYKYNVSILEKI